MMTISPLSRGGRPHLFHVGAEDAAVHGASDDEGGGDPAQGGDAGRGLPMTVWNGGVQPLTPRAATAGARHVGGGPGLVDEDPPCRGQAWLPLAPGVARGGDVGALLLRSGAGLFLSVSPSRSSVFHRPPRLAETPCVCPATRAPHSRSRPAGP